MTMDKILKTKVKWDKCQRKPMRKTVSVASIVERGNRMLAADGKVTATGYCSVRQQYKGA